MKYVKKIFLFIAVVGIFATPIYPNDTQNCLGIGMGYPYLSLKYGYSKNVAIEVRGAYDPQIYVVGARFYYNITPDKKMTFYPVFEADYISFNTEITEGSGFAGSLALGGEYFLMNRFSVSFDFGPTFIMLTETSGVEVNGIEFVVNFGLNYYFHPEEIFK